MNKNQIIIRKILFFSLLVFMFGFLLLFIFISPKELVVKVGVRNFYWMTYFVSLIGAFTSLTKFSAYPMIIALVFGQMNFIIVGFIAGLGLASGDLLFFVFGHSARGLTTKRGREMLEKIVLKIQRLRRIFVQVVIFLYVAATPFPNNLLSGALAFAGYPFKNVVLPLVLGDIAFCILVAWLAFQGIELV